MTLTFLRAFALLTQVHLLSSRVQAIPVLKQDVHELSSSPSSREGECETVNGGRFDPLTLRLRHGGGSPPSQDRLTLPLFPSYEEERKIEKARVLDRRTKEAREHLRSYQRTRRRNRSEEQVMLESAASRVRYQFRKESMTEAEMAGEKLRLSEKNKSYYQRILKPRREAFRLAREAEIGSSMSSALSSPPSSNVAPQMAASPTREATAFDDAIGSSSGFDGDESQGPLQLLKREITPDSKDSSSNGGGEPAQKEEKKKKTVGEESIPEEVGERITEWRSVPDSHRTRKQKWYANLSPEAKDRYRAKSRAASQERRDAMTEEERAIERKKKHDLEAKMKASWSEEEKKARDEIRRMKQKEYYHKVLKPRLAARKAAEALQWLAGEDLRVSPEAAYNGMKPLE